MGIVKVYVFGFDLQKSLIGSGTLPQLVSFTAFYDIAPDARRAPAGAILPRGAPLILALIALAKSLRVKSAYLTSKKSL